MSLPWHLELQVGLVDPQVLGSPWDQESIEGQEDLGSQEDLGHPLVLAILRSGTLNTEQCPVAIIAVQKSLFDWIYYITCLLVRLQAV